MRRDLDRIRSAVSMRNVLEHYGIEIGRDGFAVCPFHSDRHPSMKIYPGERGFFCFVCHEGGDIFKFIQRMDGCSFPEAVDRAAAIGGLDAEADPRWRRLERRRLKERTEKLEREAGYRFRYRLACATVHMVNRRLDGITEWSDGLAELLELREFSSRVIDEMDERMAEDGA